MNKKLILTLSLSLLMSFTSCSSSVTSSSHSEASTSSNPTSSSTSSSSYVNEGSITKTVNAYVYYNGVEEGNLDIYYFDNKDVPYTNVKEFYESSFINFVFNNKKIFSIVGNVVTNLISKATMTLDPVNDTLTFSDFDMFNNVNGDANLPTDIFTITNYESKVISLNEAGCSYTKGKEMVIKLKDFSTNLISYNNEFYIPFSYLECLTVSQNYNRYVFNGTDIFNVNLNSFISSSGALNTYGRKYYSGAYNQEKERTSDYSNYFYNSFLFEMTYFSGKLSTYKFTSLDARLDELGIKKNMLSSSSGIADNALAKAINQVFNDGGHTCFNYRGHTCEYNPTTNSKLFYALSDYDTKYNQVYNSYVTLGNERGSLNKNLDISGSTAVIRFDTFQCNSEALDLEHISTNTSTFGIIYNSFKEIEKNTAIKNVVFDLSVNLGGESTALAYAYSFISNDPVKVNIVNPVTGAKFTEAVNVDNNLDGNLTDNDSYEGKYKFYVLTSPASFSSANLFAMLSKDNAKAKIIGQTSSGGDCSIRGGISIDGTSFNMSSTLRYVYKDGSTADNGITVDYKLDSSYFYSPSKLDTYLSSL